MLQAPPELPPQPALQDLEPFVEPGFNEDYHEEMLYNFVLEEPDQDWSDWESNPSASTVISDQDNSTVSFFDGEGYQIEGFHSCSSTDQSNFNSESMDNRRKQHYEGFKQ
ncbi:hypothetical protein MKX03_027583 [Papaver bracteatum]|nr:hypothetical protein MKX03_027583 [Papaver bracteatum]